MLENALKLYRREGPGICLDTCVCLKIVHQGLDLQGGMMYLVQKLLARDCTLGAFLGRKT